MELDGAPGRLPAAESPAQTNNRTTKSFRDAAARLNWCAIVALGYEAGAWLKVATTVDVADYVKKMQTTHPELVAPRVVAFVPDKLFAEWVAKEVLEDAARHNHLMKASCVAMSVGEARAAFDAAARRVGVQLASEAEWRALVEKEERRGL